MATAANIVLADGALTPVNKTFAVASITPESASFECREGGMYLGYKRLMLGVKRLVGKKQATGNLKVRVKVDVPVLENITNSTVSGIAPAPSLAYVCVGDCIFTFPERASLQERKDAFAFMKNALATAEASLMVAEHELPY